MQEAQSEDNKDIKFKEHSKFEIIENKDEINLDIFHENKTNLVAVSNIYGFIFVGIQHTLKIFHISSIESKTFNVFAQLNLKDEEILQIHLNCTETRLILLTNSSLPNFNTGLYVTQSIYVYDLTTLAQNQFPICINQLKLSGNDDQNYTTVLNIYMSPCDADTATLCTTNCTLKSWNINNKQFDVSKKYTTNCIQYSPKGKSLVAYLDENILVYLDSKSLEEKGRVELPIDKNQDLVPNELYWFQTKEIFISLTHDDTGQIELYYVEINTKDFKCTKCVNFTDLIFQLPNIEFYVSSFFKPIVEWNLILVAATKSGEVGVLQKSDPQNELFDIQIIDDTFRAALPLASDDEDTVPVGVGLCFSAQESFELKPGVQFAACPFLFLLNNCGTLVTYHVCNQQSMNKSLCKAPTPLPAPQTVQQPTLNLSTKPKATTESQQNLFNLSTQPTSSLASSAPFSFGGPASNQFSFGPQATKPSMPPPAFGSSPFGQTTSPFQQPSTPAKPPAFNISASVPVNLSKMQQEQPKQVQAPVQQQQQQQPIIPQKPQQIQPKPQATSLFQQPQTAQQPPQSLPLIQQQQQQQQQTKPSQQTPEPQQKPPQRQPPTESKPKALDDQTHTDFQIQSFSKELNEFKEKVKQIAEFSKGIDDKLGRKTAATQNKFNDLDGEMKKLTKDCLDLRENIIGNFDLLEKLKLFQKHLSDPKYRHLLAKRDLDPATKTKFEAIKSSYNYIERELSSLNELLSENNKIKQERMADYIPRDRVFEIIKFIDTNINIHNERINKIIQVLKHLKSNAKLTHTIPQTISVVNLNKKINKAIDSVKTPNKFQTSLNESFNNTLKLNTDPIESDFIDNQFSKLEINDKLKSQKENNFKERLSDSNCDDDFKNKKKQELMENQAKAKNFYSKLYGVLSKRKQIPKQYKQLFNLELSDAKFDESKAVNIKSMNSINFGNNGAEPAESVEPVVVQTKPMVQPTTKITTPVTQSMPVISNKSSIPSSQSFVTSPISNGVVPISKSMQPFTASTPASTNETKAFFPQAQNNNIQKSLFGTKQSTETIPTSFPATGSSLFGLSTQLNTASNSKPEATTAKVITTTTTTTTTTSNVPKTTSLFETNKLTTQTFPKSTSGLFGNLTGSSTSIMNGATANPPTSISAPPIQTSVTLAGTTTTTTITTTTTTTAINAPFSNITTTTTSTATTPSTSIPATTSTPKSLFSLPQEPKKPDQLPASSSQASIFGVSTQKSLFGPSSFSSFSGFGTTDSSNSQQSTQSPSAAPKFSFGLPQSTATAQSDNKLSTTPQQPIFQLGAAKSVQSAESKNDATTTIDKPTIPTVTATSKPPESSTVPATTASQQQPQPQVASTAAQPTVASSTAPSNTQESNKLLTSLLTNNNSQPKLFGTATDSSKGFSFNLGSSSTGTKMPFSFGGEPPKTETATAVTAAPIVTVTQASTAATTTTTTASTTSAPAVTATTPVQPTTAPIVKPQANDTSLSNTASAAATPTNPPSGSIFNLSQSSTQSSQATTPSFSNMPPPSQASSVFQHSSSGFFNLKPQTSKEETTTVAPSTTTTTTTSFGFGQQQQQPPPSFLNLKPASTPTSTSTGSLFSQFQQPQQPIQSAFGSQPQGQPPAISDISMESNNNQNEVPNMFSGLGFQSKPAAGNENKNPFGNASNTGGSLFGALIAQNQQKPAFGASAGTGGSVTGGGLIKTPTFTFSNQAQTTQPGFPSSQPGAFGTNTTNTNQGGSLFNSFTSPQKPVFGATPSFGSAPAFGSAPTFGGAPAFGAAPAFGTAPTFGSTTSSGFGGGASLFGSGASSGGFGSTAPPSGNLFGGVAATNTGGLSFGQLAQQGQQQQQQPQQNQQSLFQSFTSTPSQPFGSPNTSLNTSFTAYRK